MDCRSTLRAITLFAFAAISGTSLEASQIRENVRPVPKFTGSLVLAGDGKMLSCVPKTFLHLAGGHGATVVILHSERSKADLKPWTKVGATSVVGLAIQSADELRSDETLMALSQAKGIWFDDPMQTLQEDPLMSALLESAMERGAVIGGKGATAEALAGGWVDSKGKAQHGGFGLLHDSLIHVNYKNAKERQLRAALESNLGYVAWGIPPSSSLVIHHERKVGAMGSGDVSAMVAAQNGWPQRMDGISAIDAFDTGNVAPYAADLLSWRRSAELRRDPNPFPPKVAQVPDVPKGTLFLHGGGGVNDETWRRFIKAAGGQKANFVCIPSASSFDPGQEPNSYSAGKLRDQGCRNVMILHTDDCRVADSDPTLAAILEEADGVWIDGGRTYRMMDSYQYTQIHEQLFGLLQRGGVVGGSSAGCQVLGDFLVRGNPRSNKDIIYEGYLTGLGLLEGVILDAHFLDRNRQASFEGLMEKFPQMLGIGVDVNTALIVEGSIGEVFGENPIVFYDYAVGTPKGKEGKKGLVLEPGKQYDLAKRTPK